MMSQKADRYWTQFVGSLPSTSVPQQYYEAFSFGTSKESANLIASLVIRGVKTATGSLQWVYESEGKSIPTPGDYSIVTDGEGEPVCIIQDIEVNIIPFNEVDEAFAWDGGEEDRTLDSWRRIYWEYIVSECHRIQRNPTPKTPLVCERFRVVYKEPLRFE
ncbi:MAG: ASCH domain-containing protein [Anaerolineales bacterium]